MTLGKILILYFSGSVATKVVAQAIKHILEQNSRISNSCQIDLYAVEKAGEININKYDAYVIGTPVYHCSPSKILMDYFSHAQINEVVKPAFIFNTCAMYSVFLLLY